jgi:SAM-dependent methyltransferase
MGASKAMTSENKYLWPMLRDLPYFRALLRAVEAGFYEDYELPSPVLDLGSGDGHFASVTFEKALDVGTDPAWVSLQESKGQKTHRMLTQALGDHMPFDSGYFSSAVSNSVLEHIPDLQNVLNETGRLLKRGAPFLFCVPNDKWAEKLAISGWLSKVGLGRMAGAYTQLFIRISRHVYMLSPEEWRERLKQAGFEIEEYWHYFPPKALRMLELGHYFGLPSLLSRWISGRWLLVPTKWNLAVTRRAIRKHADSLRDSEGTYSFYVARKK